MYRSIGPYSAKYDAYTIEPGGKIRQVLPDNENEFTEKEIQYYVQSSEVEQAMTADGRCIFHSNNPELKKNVGATLLYMHGDRESIRGKVLVCHRSMINIPNLKL